jgi:hypothetical protein
MFRGMVEVWQVTESGNGRHLASEGQMHEAADSRR